MKISRELKSTLASITIQDCLDVWNRKPDTELEVLCFRMNSEGWEAIERREPEIVLDNSIKLLKMYIPVFEKADKGEDNLGILKSAVWGIPYKVQEIFYYHKELPYICSMIKYFRYREHTPEILQRILDCLVAIRNNTPILLPLEEKELYKNEFTKFCKKNNLPDTLKSYFG